MKDLSRLKYGPPSSDRVTIEVAVPEKLFLWSDRLSGLQRSGPKVRAQTALYIVATVLCNDYKVVILWTPCSLLEGVSSVEYD